MIFFQDFCWEEDSEARLLQKNIFKNLKTKQHSPETA